LTPDCFIAHRNKTLKLRVDDGFSVFFIGAKAPLKKQPVLRQAAFLLLRNADA